MTGKLKAANAKSQAQETASRATEMSMATAAQEEEERTGLFDPRSGQLVEDDERTAFLAEEPPEAEVVPGFFRNDEPTFSGRESDEEVAVILADQAQKPVRRQSGRALNPIVRVRVDADVDKMTYGMHNNEPNNYNFKEGRQYEIPREVAEHLDERGLIRQWIRS
jgi:hypothetical protein